eukprot:scaffold245966_cov38-Tisochrysis_lutea.AAC.2
MGATKFILGSPMSHECMSGARAPPCPRSSPTVGEEPPTLLARLMACQEHTALLTHSPPHCRAPADSGQRCY